MAESRHGKHQDGNLLVGPGKGRQTSKKASSGSGKDDSDGEGGLLIIQKGKRMFFFALWMEFLGLMLFSLFGNSVTPEFAPAGNGLILAVLIYITANVSGGHLNPAVTFATMITGHISLLKGFLYWIAQISGGIVGTLLTVGLAPGLSVGTTAVACFVPGTGVSKGQAFGWEFFSTFLLVASVYAVAIGKPSFGNVGPLVIGLSLWGAANCAGGFTGAALNPARALGPFAVFHCYGGKIWVYILGEMAGGACAGLLSWPLYGTGPQFGKTVDPALTGEEDEESSDDPDKNDQHDGMEQGDERSRQPSANNV
jgi:aquaporin TIP